MNKPIPKCFGFIDCCILPHANYYKKVIPDFLKKNPKQKILPIHDFTAYKNIDGNLVELG